MSEDGREDRVVGTVDEVTVTVTASEEEDERRRRGDNDKDDDDGVKEQDDPPLTSKPTDHHHHDQEDYDSDATVEMDREDLEKDHEEEDANDATRPSSSAVDNDRNEDDDDSTEGEMEMDFNEAPPPTTTTTTTTTTDATPTTTTVKETLKGSDEDDNEEEDSRIPPSSLLHTASDSDATDDLVPRPSRRQRRPGRPQRSFGNVPKAPQSSKPPPEAEEEEADAQVPAAVEEEADGRPSLTEQNLIRSTDCLFVTADKDSVTVADICRALSAEYDCKIPKPMRTLVRERLVDLMKGHVVPEIPEGGDDDNEPQEEEDQVSDQGDVESDHSDFEETPDSDQEDRGQGPSQGKRTRKPKKAITKKEANTTTTKAIAKNRPSQRKAAKAARMVEAERRRNKRMEELRVRNEEMQLNQSKEEQERAEAIAAKFETNTDELRLKRLEDRLTLLDLLDKKRLAVIDELEDKLEAAASSASANSQTTPEEDPQEPTVQHTNEHSDDDSSASEEEEEELDIIGISKKPFKPLKPIHTHLSSKAVSFLKDYRSNQRTKPEPPKINNLPVSPSSFMKSVSSPTQKKGARGNLRQALKHKVRKQGNLWLARELGYKTEEDHLKDCQQVAEQKRSLVRKMEHARVESNERKLLRERMLLPDEDAVIHGDEEASSDHEGEEDEEDEELQMARMIEKEEGIMDAADDSSNASAAHGDDVDSTLEEGASDGTKVPIGTSPNDVTDDSIAVHQDDCEEEESQRLHTQAPIPSNVEGGHSPMTALDSNHCLGESTDAVVAPVMVTDALPSSQEPSEAATAALSSQAFDKEDDDDDDEEGEAQFDDEPEAPPEDNADRPRNAAWQAMLQKEAAKLKKLKKNRMQGLVDDQAEEEEEEEVAGLEDFGFSVKKKKQGDDDDDDLQDDVLDEDDLKHIVDDVSDNEGDEEAGDEARKRQERAEEQERHKDILRRMREGYDGRRGGIAGGGVGARGTHRFDQLVAADNREDARRLGLLNDDELESDDEGEKKEGKSDDNEEDEAALLDKILKDRFLHRADVDLEENFSEDEEEKEESNEKDGENDSEAEEERTQERLAKRFAKRARMQRLEEEFADSQEFSQQRLIDEDESMRQELSQMKNGLVRKRSISSGTRTSSISSQDSRFAGQKRSLETVTTGKALLDKSGSSLSIALRGSGKIQRRTSFLGGDKAGKSKDSGAFIHKSVALSHVVFGSAHTNSLSHGPNTAGNKRKNTPGSAVTTSLFSKVRKAQ